MSAELNCPTCGQRLKIPAAAGARQVRCPQCRGIFATSVADRWTVRTDDGRQYGPVDKAELDQWFAEGRLNRYSEIRQQDGGIWRPASTLYPELAAQTLTSARAFAPPQRGAASGDPFRSGAATSHRSRLAAGLLGIFLGQFGVHRFYLGFVGIGLLQLILTLATCGLTWVWGVIEGVLILAGAIDRDADGRVLRD